MGRFRQTVEERAKWPPAAPVYARIRARLTRWQRWISVGLLAALVGAVALVGLPMVLARPVHLIPNYAWSSAAAAVQHTLFVGQVLLKQGVILLAAPLAAAMARALPGEESGDALHVIPYSAREIQLARLAALLRTLLIPIAAVTALRGLLLAVGSPRLAASDSLFLPSAVFYAPSLYPTAAPPPFRPASAIWLDRMLDVLSRTGYDGWMRWREIFEVTKFLDVWPVWIGCYLLQPALDGLLVAVGGIAVWNRRPANALPAVLAVSGGLWLAGFLGERLLALGLTLARTGRATAAWLVGIPALPAAYVGLRGMFALSLLSGLLAEVGCLALLWRVALRRPE